MVQTLINFALIFANASFAYMNLVTGHPFFAIFNGCAALFMLFHMRNK